MSLLSHTFEEENHLYRCEGRYVLSTSDVIDLCGLSDMSQIPIATLRAASYRGKCLHTAVECYEQNRDWQEDFPDEFMPYLDGWFSFRDAHSVQFVGPHEKTYVYEFGVDDYAVGATIDFRFLHDGYLYIGDLKSIHPVCGKAMKQKQLAWRLQTQSYVEATEMDAPFLERTQGLYGFKGVRRAIVHIHPKLKGGYALHLFQQDDSMLWAGAVQLAMEKVAAGILPSRRNVDIAGDLRASLEVMA